MYSNNEFFDHHILVVGCHNSLNCFEHDLDLCLNDIKIKEKSIFNRILTEFTGILYYRNSLCTMDARELVVVNNDS